LTIPFLQANEWGLKPEQALALKVTWSKLCETPHSTCRGINAIMDQKNKAVREIFYSAAFFNGISEHRKSYSIATLHDHSHFFISLISQVIHSFDFRSVDILEHIDKIGVCHAGLKKFGFRQAVWEQLGEELIDALVVQVCIKSLRTQKPEDLKT
uniref:GLOBIN domain-containing protein n=1 Tax=Gongylonema pulchrum TaxID=637853 RepID=A0A183D3I1_9BILA